MLEFQHLSVVQGAFAYEARAGHADFLTAMQDNPAGSVEANGDAEQFIIRPRR